jgi:hypothetical protein
VSKPRWLSAPPGWVWIQIGIGSDQAGAMVECSGSYPVAYFELFADEEFSTQYGRPVTCLDRALLECVDSDWLDVASGEGIGFVGGSWKGAGLVGPTEDPGQAFNELRSKVQARWVSDPKGTRHD